MSKADVLTGWQDVLDVAGKIMADYILLQKQVIAKEQADEAVSNR